MQRKYIAFIFINAFLLLTVCSMTSFLFPIHNRVDQNCFMTLGKGILNGQVPYRDLFEQKGPIIYFIHALANLISDTSFLGVFLIQYISLIVLMIYLRKISCLFMSEKASYLAVLITTVLILTSHFYSRGDNVEEYFITLITISIYYTLYHHVKNKDMSVPYWIFFINGLFIGIVFWTKYNLLGYWIGWALFAFIPMLLHKKYKHFIKAILFTIFGFALITLPIIIYFGANGALNDLFYAYFYCNIFLYDISLGILSKFIFLFYALVINFFKNPVLSIVLIIGIIGFLFQNKFIKDKVCRIGLFVSLIMMYIGIYFGGRCYRYYGLLLGSYVILGVIVITDYTVKRFKTKHTMSLFKHYKKLFSLLIIITLISAVAFSNCLPYMGMQKSDYAQFQFAEKINKKENATLLNYGFLDGGFYFAARLQPNYKYYHTVNIPTKKLPIIYETQLGYIKNKTIDFVVTRVPIEKGVTDVNCPELYENYKVIATAVDKHDNYRFILFQRK